MNIDPGLFFILWVVAILAYMLFAPSLDRIDLPKRKPKKTPHDYLKEISQRRIEAVDSAHAAWEEWWTTVTDYPVPVRAKDKRVEPSVGGASFTYDEVVRAMDDTGDFVLYKQLKHIVDNMDPDGWFRPTSGRIYAVLMTNRNRKTYTTPYLGLTKLYK